jgi:hypothetical protein
VRHYLEIMNIEVSCYLLVAPLAVPNILPKTFDGPACAFRQLEFEHEGEITRLDQRHSQPVECSRSVLKVRIRKSNRRIL